MNIHDAVDGGLSPIHSPSSVVQVLSLDAALLKTATLDAGVQLY